MSLLFRLAWRRSGRVVGLGEESLQSVMQGLPGIRFGAVFFPQGLLSVNCVAVSEGRVLPSLDSLVPSFALLVHRQCITQERWPHLVRLLPCGVFVALCLGHLGKLDVMVRVGEAGLSCAITMKCVRVGGAPAGRGKTHYF